MIKFLLKCPPYIELKKEKMKEDADFDIEIIIDSYQLIGAVCLFDENTVLRNHGMILWRKAFELLCGHGLTTSNFVPLTLTVLAFGEHSKIKSESELEDMEDDQRQIQCLLVTQRISMKYTRLHKYVTLPNGGKYCNAAAVILDTEYHCIFTYWPTFDVKKVFPPRYAKPQGFHFAFCNKFILH
jgi:hypothetical protein